MHCLKALYTTATRDAPPRDSHHAEHRWLETSVRTCGSHDARRAYVRSSSVAVIVSACVFASTPIAWIHITPSRTFSHLSQWHPQRSLPLPTIPSLSTSTSQYHFLLSTTLQHKNYTPPAADLHLPSPIHVLLAYTRLSNAYGLYGEVWLPVAYISARRPMGAIPHAQFK